MSTAPQYATLAKQFAEETRKRKEDHLEKVSSACLKVITDLLSKPDATGVYWTNNYSIVNITFDKPLNLIRMTDEIAALRAKVQTIGFDLTDHSLASEDWCIEGLKSVKLSVRQ